MHKNREIVINTGPLLALIAATGNLDILKSFYESVYVSYEVCNEILHGGNVNFGIKEFEMASFLKKEISPVNISPILKNTLDIGEASVIQLAQNRKILMVCIFFFQSSILFLLF